MEVVSPLFGTRGFIRLSLAGACHLASVVSMSCGTTALVMIHKNVWAQGGANANPYIVENEQIAHLMLDC
jgi:hypothetical protein